ncbi:DNA repair exonuclease [Halobacillus rhizosphaerae]|uniref:metallophosphoesterase family protein n=1 Tax=Halobacillus rhizosphaerae TaxID=3064889 RepID=UPI00398B2A52
MESHLRFIHSADLHLDSPFTQLSGVPESLIEQLRASTFEAFTRLIDQAIHHKVHMVLIAGDLFNESTRSLKAQIHLRNGFRRLDNEGIQVYITHGNHDYLKGMRHPVTYPDNVHVFTQETVEVLPLIIAGTHTANIYGFSYVEKQVTDRKAAEFTRDPTCPLHIAMLHGSLDGPGGDHDVYASFSLEELREQSMDYWALGHIHKRQHLSIEPPIIYPGNIQGRSRKEQGEKGCYLVEHSFGEWAFEFLPLQSIVYEHQVTDNLSLESPHEIEPLVNQIKSNLKENYSKVMLSLTFQGKSGWLQKWKSEGVIENWREVLNEEEVYESSWVFITEININDQPEVDEAQLIQSNHFSGEFLRDVEKLTEDQWNEWLKPLVKHKRAAAYLTPFTEEEKQDIISGIKEKTLPLLLKDGETNS